MTTLLTGATGTVGSAIAAALVAEGRPVRALVRDVARARSALPAEIEFVAGDVTDAASVERAMAGVTHVFHAAGLPEQWQRDPGIFGRVNVDGTRHVAEAALRAGVTSFVYTSTIDVFAWPARRGDSFDESTLDTTPKHTHYERSKQDADRLVTALVECGLPARFVCPAGVFGRAAFLTPGANRLIVGLVKNDIPVLLPGGLPLVEAADCARLHLLAEHAPVGGRYIGCDRYVTLRELAEAVHAIAPRAKVPRTLPLAGARALAAVGDAVSKLTRKPPLLSHGELSFLTHEVRPDADRARRELGWTPTPFADALAATVRWATEETP